MNEEIFVVGYGEIGRQIIWQSGQQGWKVRYVARSDGVYSIGGTGALSLVKKWGMLEMDFKALNLGGLAAAFIATPPSPYGEIGRRYAVLFARLGIPMIICDKSLMAHYPGYMRTNGFMATVGGGSQLLPFLKEHVRGEAGVSVQIIPNATLNFIMTNDGDIDENVAEAVRLGITEPGAEGCLGTINGEVADTVLKTCITAEHCFPQRSALDRTLKPDDIKVNVLTERDLHRLRAEKAFRRYIVSFSRFEPREQDIIGGFHVVTNNGWHVVAGFKTIHLDPRFANLRIYGVNNGAAISIDDEGDYIAHLVGIGAGPRPTVRAMMQDAKRILKID